MQQTKFLSFVLNIFNIVLVERYICKLIPYKFAVKTSMVRPWSVFAVFAYLETDITSVLHLWVP